MAEKKDLWWDAFSSAVATAFVGTWPPAEWMSDRGPGADISERHGLHDDDLEFADGRVRPNRHGRVWPTT